MKQSNEIGELSKDLAQAQTELKNPGLDSTNPHFKSKFASLANIRNTVTAVFAKHGIAVIQSLSSDEKAVSCSTMLLHKSGQWIESDAIRVPAAKPDAQGFGSASTYARRYSLAAFANVVGDDDDDGNAASAPEKKLSPVRPNAVGEEKFAEASQEEREFLNKQLSTIRDFIDSGDASGAARHFYDTNLDEMEKAAIWSQLTKTEKQLIAAAHKKAA